MKTSSWVKVIGILCIVFGALGITNNISSFFVPQWILDTWPEIPPVRQKWMERLALIGIIVNIIYLMAGIFFLYKKPFSLILMYGSLTFSLLYVVIPWFFFKPYDELIFVVIGPIIDICLLIGVFRIRKYYDKSPDEVVKLFGEMKFSPTLLKRLTLVGLLSLFVPLSILGLWIHASNIGANHSESVTIFDNYFPDFLHGSLNSLSMAFSILAIIISSICLNSLRKLFKTLNIIILFLGILLLLLNLFQMM